MAVYNEENAPTFIRGSSESHIDVTFASARICGNINNWRVSDMKSLRLYKYITFDVDVTAAIMQQLNGGWVVGKIDRTLLSIALAVVKVAKEKSWADLITTIDNDLWGNLFKMVMKRLRMPKSIPCVDLKLSGRAHSH